MATAVEDQEAIFKELMKTGKATDFGKDHHLGEVLVYEEYVGAVPVRTTSSSGPISTRSKKAGIMYYGRANPSTSPKTSGTTSGIKYIPISKESIGNHINTARNALLCYIAESGNTRFTNGKMIFYPARPSWNASGHTYRPLERDREPPCAQLSAQESTSFIRDQLHRRMGKQAGQNCGGDDERGYDPYQWHPTVDADVL